MPGHTKSTLALMMIVACFSLFEIPAGAAEITEIDDPVPVAKAFNAGAGKPRLVLLLSPT